MQKLYERPTVCLVLTREEADQINQSCVTGWRLVEARNDIETWHSSGTTSWSSSGTTFWSSSGTTRLLCRLCDPVSDDCHLAFLTFVGIHALLAEPRNDIETWEIYDDGCITGRGHRARPGVNW